jgi:hypothetical protein
MKREIAKKKNKNKKLKTNLKMTKKKEEINKL